MLRIPSISLPFRLDSSHGQSRWVWVRPWQGLWAGIRISTGEIGIFCSKYTWAFFLNRYARSHPYFRRNMDASLILLIQTSYMGCWSFCWSSCQSLCTVADPSATDCGAVYWNFPAFFAYVEDRDLARCVAVYDILFIFSYFFMFSQICLKLRMFTWHHSYFKQYPLLNNVYTFFKPIGLKNRN